MPEITELIPQRAPILEVDRLLSCSAENAETELVVRQDNFFYDNGRLTEPGLIEHVAQSSAAFAGYAGFANGEKPHLGYIGEIKKCTIFRLPLEGEVLRTSISLVSQVGPISLIRGVTTGNGSQILECQMKIFLKDE